MTRLRVNMTAELTQKVLQSLRKLRILTVLSFLENDLEALSNKCCIQYKTLTAIRKNLLSKFSLHPKNGSFLYEEMMMSCIFSTGCENLDLMLDSGIYAREITEICGPSNCGKSQLCFTILSQMLIESEKSAIYIDTQANFSAQRIQQLLANDMEHSDILQAMKRIYHIPIFDPYTFLEVLSDGKNLCKKFSPGLTLVIVDSLSAIFSLLQLTNHSDGMGLIVQAAQALKVLALEFDFAVVITNNVVLGNEVQPFKPALRKYWKHVPSVVLFINHGDNTDRKEITVTMTKSSRQCGGKTLLLNLNESGFEPI